MQGQQITTDRETLTNEFLGAQIPKSLRTHIFKFLDGCFGYAHFYASIVGICLWLRYTIYRDYAPGEAIEVFKFVRVRGGRCFRKNGFRDLQFYFETQLGNIKTSILKCLEVVVDDGSVIFNVSGAFIPICLARESSGRIVYSGTAGTIKYFTSKSVFRISGVNGKQKTNADDSGHTINAIDSFVKSSTMLQKRSK